VYGVNDLGHERRAACTQVTTETVLHVTVQLLSSPIPTSCQRKQATIRIEFTEIRRFIFHHIGVTCCISELVKVGANKPITRRLIHAKCLLSNHHDSYSSRGWLGSRVVSVLDSGAEGPRFKSQLRRCRVTVLGKLFTPIVPLFTKQQNW